MGSEGVGKGEDEEEGEEGADYGDGDCFFSGFSDHVEVSLDSDHEDEEHEGEEGDGV